MVDGEAMILLQPTRTYYVLNSVAARVWELLDGRRGFMEICEQITSEFDVDREVAEKDVRDYLDDLRENGMLAGPDDEAGGS